MRKRKTKKQVRKAQREKDKKREEKKGIAAEPRAKARNKQGTDEKFVRLAEKLFSMSIGRGLEDAEIGREIREAKVTPDEDTSRRDQKAGE